MARSLPYPEWQQWRGLTIHACPAMPKDGWLMVNATSQPCGLCGGSEDTSDSEKDTTPGSPLIPPTTST